MDPAKTITLQFTIGRMGGELTPLNSKEGRDTQGLYHQEPWKGLEKESNHMSARLEWHGPQRQAVPNRRGRPPGCQKVVMETMTRPVMMSQRRNRSTSEWWVV